MFWGKNLGSYGDRFDSKFNKINQSQNHLKGQCRYFDQGVQR